MKNITMMLALAALASTVLVGCDSEDTKTYDVTISWTIGGSQLCVAPISVDESVAFDDVTISVYENEGDEEPFDGPFTVPCDSFTYDIPRLKRGTYWVVVEAWGELDDMELPLYSEGMEVKAPEQQDGYSFGLMQSPSEIRVVWDFEAGMCGANNVVDVVIVPPDEEVPCDDGVYTIEDLIGFNTYTVTVNGLDEDGDVIMSGSEQDIYIRPGEEYESFVILE